MDDKWEPPLIEGLADIIYAQEIPGWDMGDAFALAEELLAEIGKTHKLVEHERVGPFPVVIDSDMPEGEIRIVDSDGTVLGSITGIGP
jgi:hypothetical protein